MTKTFVSHPIYCSCCPGRPQVMAEKLGDHLLEIRARKHGREHVALVLLDKKEDAPVSSEEDQETDS